MDALIKRIKAANDTVWDLYDKSVPPSDNDRWLNDFVTLVSLPLERRFSFRTNDGAEVLSLSVGDIRRMSPTTREIFSLAQIDKSLDSPGSTLWALAEWAEWYERGVEYGELKL
jgi:hypothetical protein